MRQRDAGLSRDADQRAGRGEKATAHASAPIAGAGTKIVESLHRAHRESIIRFHKIDRDASPPFAVRPYVTAMKFRNLNSK
jgi:hypothetical protein